MMKARVLSCWTATRDSACCPIMVWTMISNSIAALGRFLFDIYWQVFIFIWYVQAVLYAYVSRG